jgi:hypothetical protein
MSTDVIQVQLFAFVALGAAGGLISFLVALRQDHYKNDRYIKKSSIEVLGGAVTASCLVYVFRESQYVYVFAFLIGTAWSHIIQRIRSKITSIVEAALGDTPPRSRR